MRIPRLSICSVTTFKHDASDVPERTARLFCRLALRQGNSAFTSVVESASDRLHAMRQLDERVIGNTREELPELESTAETATASALAKQVRQLHSRRKEEARHLCTPAANTAARALNVLARAMTGY